MARARNIKPGFFKNEDLGECSLAARLCFVGLWVLADREGRLEDRPKRIKGELFPFDAFEVEPLLDELAERAFIVRYANEEGRFIQVTKFAAHQSPHYSEKPSVIKPPELRESGAHEDGIVGGYLREDSEKSGSMKRGSQPPDSLILRFTDSPNPEEVSEADASSSPRATRSPAIPCPYQEVVERYHQALPMLPRVRLMSDKRKAAMRKLWAWVLKSTKADGTRRASTADEALQWFADYFSRAAMNGWLTGRAPRSAEHATWQCDIDFLLTEKGLKAVIEKTEVAA